jgi:hypothetical protein
MFYPAGTGAVATTIHSKLRERVSVLDFGADPTGTVSSNTAITNAQEYLALVGGGTLFFPPGQYKVTSPIPMKPGITYLGPMRANLSSYNPNRSRIFSSTGDIFANSATTITGVCFRDLFIESEVGGGHVFDWSSAGIVSQIEMAGVCLAQRNASKCIILGNSLGGVFSIWLHDFEYVYVPACIFPPLWFASPTINSIVIEKFWSTSNGQSAAGNPSIWVESTNAVGAGFNVEIRQGVFELAASGCVRLLSCTNSVIEDCTSYDMSIAPGYYAFSIDRGVSGLPSSNIALKRCRSTTGTVAIADLFINMSVVGQGSFLIEGCTFAYTHGVSASGCYIEVSGSNLGIVTDLSYVEINGGPTKTLAFNTTLATGANVAFWNGYPGNRDGSLNITVNDVHVGSISNSGIFLWGNAYITQDGIIQAGHHIYPGTPVGSQQVAAGLLAGTGVPIGGNDGDFYFRGDGGAGTSIYMKRAGVWVGIV